MCFCMNEYIGYKIITKCNHTFHLECLREWFCRNSTCPICRLENPSDNKLTKIDSIYITISVLEKLIMYEIKIKKLKSLIVINSH